MALRNQPYIPLYVQDVLTDEKLIECSAESHGIYFRLLCILHKQQTYGKIILKEKYKNNPNQYFCFAQLLSRQMPFDTKQIQTCLQELDEESVIHITDDTLIQKRMIKDGEISTIRQISGKKGGSNVTKQYGKKGFLYFMSDYAKRNKIGISVNPQNRLYRLRSDLHIKELAIIETVEVDNMGEVEDNALSYFEDIRDGEWINIEYKEMCKKFTKFKANIQAKNKANTQAKVQATTESEYEDENDNENTTKKDVNTFFDSIWKLYPEKKGKASISDKTKNKLFNIGFEVLSTCIDRYKNYIKETGYNYKNGSTFFNSGYVDYLDENYEENTEGKNYDENGNELPF